VPWVTSSSPAEVGDLGSLKFHLSSEMELTNGLSLSFYGLSVLPSFSPTAQPF